MPKFGQLIATDVWAAAARTLTDFSAEQIFDLPAIDDNYGSAEVTSSTSVDTYGSWGEIVADVGVGKRLIAILVNVAQELTSGNYAEIEIGEGASGSEAAVTRYLHASGSSSQHKANIVVPLWKALTDNARLSVRVKDADTDAVEYRVSALIA